MRKQTIEQYFLFLESKGFRFHEDVFRFVQFGKQYVQASDELTIMALEWTLKIQKQFDGSFFLSLLEEFCQQRLETRQQVQLFMKEKGLID
ncbi:hypothetical protein GFC29_555 [Anoxybacillus sp. B7M1]|jgi:Family of unknown function (DUF6123)|uniref:DUF6123 family protein n=1 Tax=Anoxybacteroides rupiense TaxID=311460 RepID=A0ABD5IZ70_9BACL|nr:MULTISPECIES: DUF6123 family protein [Anoxybacillus]ANB56285.1 hypothetical protein GFC28_1072 [Anoxybacillus sp. B2M1]ANB63932.1 hypothetical protein GFC29_555 [Anoxybacillus sp. B7M1]KXG10706.1 hypothetical protein AT864_01297 [Anoxybacillus sp. P3H1B]MBB3906003.1 hypothetical protein [Anoxybacillus rupiensis]MBS2772846.1 hypothetical protein [Anoxybacillus rupiensis]